MMLSIGNGHPAMLALSKYEALACCCVTDLSSRDTFYEDVVENTFTSHDFVLYQGVQLVRIVICLLNKAFKMNTGSVPRERLGE